LTAYLSLAKAQKGLLDAIIEHASTFWKASTLYALSPQAAQEYFRKRRLEIEADIILHAGEETIGGGGGTTEQLTQILSPETRQLVTPITPPTPLPTKPAAEAVMAGLTAIPRMIIPTPENVRILFEKPVESLAESLAASPTAVIEYSRHNLADTAMRMAESGREMLRMASQIATAISLKTPVTVEGLTVTPEKALDMLRNAFQAGYNILVGFIESIATLTEHAPLTIYEESKILDAVTETTANLTAIRQMAQQPPRTLPPLKLKTIYGYEYICAICGAVYYEPAELEAHRRATGHGTL
jgi:hypothetical protein